MYSRKISFRNVTMKMVLAFMLAFFASDALNAARPAVLTPERQKSLAEQVKREKMHKRRIAMGLPPLITAPRSKASAAIAAAYGDKKAAAQAGDKPATWSPTEAEKKALAPARMSEPDTPAPQVQTTQAQPAQAQEPQIQTTEALVTDPAELKMIEEMYRQAATSQPLPTPQVVEQPAVSTQPAQPTRDLQADPQREQKIKQLLLNPSLATLKEAINLASPTKGMSYPATLAVDFEPSKSLKLMFGQAVQSLYQKLRNQPAQAKILQEAIMELLGSPLLLATQKPYLQNTVLPQLKQVATTATPTVQQVVQQEPQVFDEPTFHYPKPYQQPQPQVNYQPVYQQPQVRYAAPTQATTNAVPQINQALTQANENGRIQALYGLMQQAAGQQFDASSQQAFAQAIVQVFNQYRTLESYMTQLLQGATTTPLLNQEQQNYVGTSMIPLFSGTQVPSAPVAQGIADVPQAEAAIAAAPGAFVPSGDLPLTKAKKKKRKKKKRKKRKKRKKKTKKKRKKKKSKKRKKKTTKKKRKKRKAKKKKRRKKRKKKVQSVAPVVPATPAVPAA